MYHFIWYNILLFYHPLSILFFSWISLTYFSLIFCIYFYYLICFLPYLLYKSIHCFSINLDSIIKFGWSSSFAFVHYPILFYSNWDKFFKSEILKLLFLVTHLYIYKTWSYLSFKSLFQSTILSLFIHKLKKIHLSIFITKRNINIWYRYQIIFLIKHFYTNCYHLVIIVYGTLS